MKTLENIRNRLLQNAKVKFQSNKTDLDHEKKLFIDWMASELYGLYKEMDNSRSYIEKNIKQHLTPEISTRPMPAHTIAQAIPNKPGQLLKPSEDVFTANRYSDQPPFEIYFSPLKPTKLIAAKVKWKCYGHTLKEVIDSELAEEKAKTKNGLSFHPGIMWLGIELEKGEAPPFELTFYFDNGLEDRKEAFFRLLPLIQWIQEDKEINAEIGMEKMFDNKGIHSSKYLDNEYLHLHSLEKKVIEEYNNQFITVSNKQGFKLAELPEEIKNNFDEEILEGLNNKKYIWLKLVFPNGITPETIQNTKIRLNCFPIINRKMDKSKDFSPSHFGSIEICALTNADNRRGDLGHTGDFFLGIDRIFSNNVDYRTTTFESFKEVPTGYYALQQGRVEFNDFRDVMTRTDELLLLLKTNSARLKQVSGHSIQSALHNLESGFFELENALQQTDPQTKDAGYYLHLKAADPQDMIYIRFWLTQGVSAYHVLSKGDLLDGGKICGILKI